MPISTEDPKPEIGLAPISGAGAYMATILGYPGDYRGQIGKLEDYDQANLTYSRNLREA